MSYGRERIRKNYFACGCDVGKTFLKYSLLLIISGLFSIYIFQKSKLSLSIWLYSTLFIFLMTALGKAIGKAIAYRTLRKEISALKNYLA